MSVNVSYMGSGWRQCDGCGEKWLGTVLHCGNCAQPEIEQLRCDHQVLHANYQHLKRRCEQLEGQLEHWMAFARGDLDLIRETRALLNAYTAAGSGT